MIDTITAFKTNPDLISGGEKSGAGQFSEVYLTPCGEYAIKHGNHGFADGWLLYAAKLLTIPADDRPWWAPVIHSLRVDMETGRFTALLKSYTEPDCTDDIPTAGGYISELMETIRQGLPDLDEDEEYDDVQYILLESPEFDNAPVECVEFLYEIQNASGVDLFFDICGNSMYSDSGKIVLNDPCCVRRWKAAKESQMYRDEFQRYLKMCAEKAPDLQLRGRDGRME